MRLRGILSFGAWATTLCSALGCNAVFDIQEKQPGNADGGGALLSVVKPPPRSDGTASTIRVMRGTTASVDLALDRSGGFAGTLAVVVSGLTRGIVVDPLVLPPSHSTGTLTIHAADSAELGLSSLAILGAHDGVFSSPLSLPLMVQDASGTPDTTFGTAGQVALPVGPGGVGSGGIKLLPNGSFVVCGHAKSAGLDSSIAIARITESGALDPTFALGAGFTLGNMASSTADACAAVFIRPNGGIVFTGTTTPVADQPAALVTARYRPDGFPDLNFGIAPGGFGATTFDGTGSEGDCIVGPTANDTFVVGGFGRGSPALLRFSKNGQLDTTFGTEVAQELSAKGAIRALAQQADGSFVAAVESPTLLVARFGENGALDKTFGDNGTKSIAIGTRGWRPAVVVAQPDDAILVAGTEPIDSGGASDISLARLTKSGQVDSAFGTGGVGTVHFAGASSVSSAVESDGAIVIAGQTPTDAGPAFTVLRISADGSLDATFGTAGRQTLGVGMAQAVTVDDLGRILVAGFSGGSIEGSIVIYRLWP